MSDEQPGMVGRIGQVIYWIGCTLGILSILVALWILLISFIFDRGPSNYGAALSLTAGLAIWMVGLAAHYVLKGGWPIKPDTLRLLGRQVGYVLAVLVPVFAMFWFLKGY